MCATLAHAVRCSARQDSFDLRDMHKQKSMPFATDAVEKEIHVLDQEGRSYRGAQAILKIASQYPRLRMLAAIGQFPIIRPLLPVGYNVIARNRRFRAESDGRIGLLRRADHVPPPLDRAAHLSSGSRTELSTVINLSG
jgi:predicted DCC family thiol-disulfide oxidoreductase YuxK